MSASSKKWGFRRRLTLLIFVVFLMAGACLVAVQYFLTKQALGTQIETSATDVQYPCLSALEDPSLTQEVVDDICSDTAPYFDTQIFSISSDQSGNEPAGWAASEGVVSRTQVAEAGTTDDILSSSNSLIPIENYDEAAIEGQSGATAGYGYIDYITFSSSLSSAVMTQLLLSSAAILLIFVVVAVLAANWLAGRSLGRIDAITNTVKDITVTDRSKRLALEGPRDEVKELADTIDSMLSRLDQAITQQERFIATASHELRTPLSTTRTALEVPLVQGRFPDSVRTSVERALKANAHSEELMAALLVLAEVQMGAPKQTSTIESEVAEPDDSFTEGEATEILQEEMRPYQVIQAAVAELSDLAEQHEVTFIGLPDFDIDLPELPALSESESLLKLAVSNLLKNSVIHNHAGGQVWIRVVDPLCPKARESDTGVTDTEETSAAVTGAGVVDSKLVIQIENDGNEMSADLVEKIAEPFNRGTQTKLSGQGLGLGLTVVTAVAERLGGNLHLEPRTEGGLSATFSVPL